MKAHGILGKAIIAACAAFTIAAFVPGFLLPAQAEDNVFEIENGNDLVDFADDVNGGRDFDGIEVKLVESLNMGGSALVPIGTKEHPFKGTFNGNGRTIRNFTVSGSQYVGLFGYVGEGGSIEDLTIGSNVVVTASSDSEVVKCVGSVAGYVYGTAGTVTPAIKGCKSSAVVEAVSTMDVCASNILGDQAPDADLGSSSDNANAIEYVGGLAGYCAGSIDSCRFTGSVNVTTHQPSYPDKPSIARSIGGIAGQVGGYALEHVNNGKQAFEPFYPLAAGGYSRTGTVGLVSGCRNSGEISTVIDAVNGVDRFGEEQETALLGVGGIAGSAMCNIVNCTNTGTVNSQTAEATGGIVGTLRGTPVSGMSTIGSDPGCYKDASAPETERLSGPKLCVRTCMNNAQVTGLHAVGGIAGCTGAYTLIQACSNRWTGSKAGVVGTRWRKPRVGGIGGQIFGSVKQCYSRAACETRTGAGYYVAGVVGALERWEKISSAEFDGPAPELGGCYATGAIENGAGARTGAICGENKGFIHDCYYLKGNVRGDAAVASNKLVVKNATVRPVSKAAELKSKTSVAALNASTTVDEYKSGFCFVNAPDSDANNGYPVLSHERDTGETAISDGGVLEFGSMGAAQYIAAGNPAPQLEFTYNGQALVQGADYYALPSVVAVDNAGNCKDVVELAGTTLYAKVVGMGDFTSGPEGVGSAPYKIQKGNFRDCTASIQPKMFNFDEQSPDPNGVEVKDSLGNVVPADSYTYALNNSSDVCIGHKVTYASQTGDDDGLQHIGYMFKFTPEDNSNYDSTSCTYGYFDIQRVNLSDNDVVTYEGIEYGGTVWSWHPNEASAAGTIPGYPYRMVGGQEVRGMQVVYTGEEIRPTFTAVTVLDGSGNPHELKLGVDYEVEYGDPGSADGAIIEDVDSFNTNVTSDVPGKRACLTIGAFAGDKSNFENYQDIFFDIVQADVASDCTVKLPGKIVGIPTASDVSVTGYTGTKISSDNYNVSYSRVGSDKLQIVVSGKKNLKGSFSKTVDWEPASIEEAKVTLSATGAVYTGKGVTVGVKSVKLGEATLKAGNDFSINYSNNVNVGMASVTLSGKGYYTGTVKAAFKVLPKSTKLKKLKKGKKCFTAVWAKQAVQTTGYELRYALKKNMAAAKTITIKKTKTVKAKVKKLKAKNNYYVQIRTFKSAGSAKFYSNWSATKSVKVK